ncbi:MAG: Gfo/Idh/MocA family oxidoreductase [Clostridia bacterium]|nr:Gfo/Idh/MocA family oxidoreductase [Clostridia bacterium]
MKDEKKSPKVYGVAVIGCGQMGEEHLKHIYFKENVRISFVCDTNEEKARLAAKKYAAAAFCTEARVAIESPETDVVIIATYPSTHLPLLRLCLAAGKHVVCEKPIATCVEDGREFCRLVKEHPECRVLVGHILRHNKTYQTVAEMIRGGAIGSPIAIRMTQNHHCLNWERYLRLIEETGPVVDCGVHYVDVMQWFTGEKVTSVSGVGMRTDPTVPEGKQNYEMITVKLSGGSVGFYEAGWSRTASSCNTKEFIGPKGSIRIFFSRDRQSHREEGDLIEFYSLEDHTYRNIDVVAERKPTDLQLDHLIRMIEEDEPATPTIDEVLEAFEIVLEAERKISE